MKWRMKDFKVDFKLTVTECEWKWFKWKNKRGNDRSILSKQNKSCS